MKKLRIALIIDSQNYLAWHNTIISDLLNSKFAEIVLQLNFDSLIIQKQNLEPSLPVLWKLFLKIDSKFFKPKPDALAKANIEDLLPKIPSYQISNNFLPSDIDSHHLDVIVNLTEINLDFKLQDAAIHGVWFLNHCDLKIINKRPYGIWEMLKKEPETIATLRFVKNSYSSPNILDTTSICTDSLSYIRNINALYWQASSLIYNNIKLLSSNEALFNAKLNTNTEQSSNSKISVPFMSPSNFKILRFSLSLYFKKLVQVVKSQFYIDQWALIFYNNKNNSDPFALKNYTKILPPKDRFWADPFLVKKDNTYYLFIEELIYKNKLGHLAVMTIDEYGNYTKPENILVKDYHLSYPNVFEDNGTYYMIPETSGNQDIQLYKSTNFPLKWELEKVLMSNVVAVDTTIYKNNDTYWMFTNLKTIEGGSKHVELYLFYSKDLISDQWEAHPLNPIVSDIKKSRPAGAFFKMNNKLYRPSQNCSNHYGYGLNIAEVTKLDKTTFEEQIIKSIKPDWDKAIGSTHSFNSVDNLYISDISIKRSRFF